MQFYLVWPLWVYAVPRRALAWVFAGTAALAPLSRFVIHQWLPGVHHPGALTPAALDYLGTGALLALALARGMQAGDPRLRRMAWAALAGYVVLYGLDVAGRPVPGLCHFQQTLLAVAMAGLISSTLAGLRGPVGRALEHPAIQHLGRLSYGLYLFHTAVPLLLGWLLPPLWDPRFEAPLLALRLPVFALATWGIAWLCWRWFEGPRRLSLLR
jgi:peptidoglycan/LPS O-acetylase OafA/YrhL